MMVVLWCVVGNYVQGQVESKGAESCGRFGRPDAGEWTSPWTLGLWTVSYYMSVCLVTLVL